LFVIVSFPIADARRLFSQDAIFNIPSWPLYCDQHDSGQPLYTRRFGKVEERTKGGIDPWPGEDFYVDASRALRFEPPLHRYIKFADDTWGYLACRFRRFYFDALATSRVEVGFRLIPKTGWSTTRHTLDEVLSPILAAQVSIPRQNGDARNVPLLSAGPALAKHVERMTLPPGHAASTDDPSPLVVAGTPLIFVEGTGWSYVEAPEQATEVTPSTGLTARLIAVPPAKSGARYNCWIVNSGRLFDEDTARRVRIHLTRLHQTREVTKKVLEILSKSKGGKHLERGDQCSENLQEFLNDSAGLLLKERRYGFDQVTLLDAAYQADELLSERHRATLLSRIEHFRRSIRRKVEQVTTPHTINIVNEHIRGDKVVGNKMNMGNGNTFHGNVVLAKNIKNSFNAMPTENMEPELVELIKELSGLVEEAIPKVDEGTATQMSQDFETLTKEAATEAPRKQWVSLSLDSIIKGTEKLVDVGGKVAALAAKIAAMC